VRVRKAMSLAMDREEIIQGAVQGGAVRTGFLPVGIKDYAWGPEKSTQKFSYNPEQAKSLLKEAGYDSGQLEVTLDFGQDYTQDSEIVGRQLNAVGIQVKLAPSTVGTAALLSGATFGLVYGAPTGSSYLPERWFGPPLRTGGSTNFYRLSDPQVDALSAAQNRELDTTKRKQIMDQLQDRLYDIMAFAPVMSRFYYHFQTCQVKNVRPQHPTFNKEGLAHAWIDPTGCQ
jgi:peptide/nickel transport system substrate-binding protein